nr:hypothetical protein [Tanacetum cinerariifolium]
MLKPTIVATEEVNKDGFTAVINKRKNGKKQTNPNPNKLGEIKLNVPKKFEYRCVFGTKPTVGENESDVIKIKNHFVVFSEHENLVKQLEEGELSGRSTNDTVLSIHDNNRDSDSEEWTSNANLCSKGCRIILGWNTDVGYHMYRVVTKMKALKKPLRKLLHSHGILHDRVNALRNEVDEIQKALDCNPLDNNLCEEAAAYVSSFIDAKLDEGCFLKQKAKIKWLDVGDSNFAFFHKSIKSRNQRIQIKCIRDVADVEVTGPLVADCFVTHYQQFLGTNMECDRLDIEGLFLKRISNDTSFNMVRNVSNEEIKTAMFGIGDNQARDQMDDLLIFTRGDVDSARLIMESLDEFQKSSGLVTSVPKRELLVKYLGVPLISSRLLNRDCKVFFVKFSNRIGDWKNKSLSYAGLAQTPPNIGSCQAVLLEQTWKCKGFTLKTSVVEFVSSEGWLWPQSWLLKAPNYGLITVSSLEETQIDQPQWHDFNGVFLRLKAITYVGNKIHKAFPLPGESSHWQYKFPLPVEGVPTARRMEIPLPGVCTAMMKNLNKGKAIVNSLVPTYDQEPKLVAQDDALSKEKEIDKLMALTSLSFKKIYKLTNNNLLTSSNTNRARQDNTPRINRGTGYDNHRLVNVVGARENIVDQDDDDLAKERDLLASLIDKLKCEIDDSKNHNKILESLNNTLVDKLKVKIEDFKTKIKVKNHQLNILKKQTINCQR